MYVNMTTEKLAVPLNDEGKLASNFSKNRRKKASKNMLVVAGALLFVIINTFLIVVTTLTLSRVKILEVEVDLLKNSIPDSKLSDDVIKAIAHFENDMDLSYEEIGNDDYSEYDNLDFYDQFNETKDLAELIENLKLATNLTKEGRESSRTKRNVVAATEDGVIINSESYAERKANNNTRRDRSRTRGHSITAIPARPSSIGSPPWNTPDTFSSEEATPVERYTKSPRRSSPPVYVRQSRVMHREGKSKGRKTVKKASLKSGDMYSGEVTASPEFTIVRDLGRRRYRQRHLALETLDENRTRMGRVKLPVVHYSGDTSKYVLGQHTNFNGNGHLKHPQSTFIDWKVSDWATSAGMDAYFSMEDGILTVKETGIYFIYAQIYYLDEHDTTGFRVYRNRDTILLQCTITIHSSERALRGNTCYTAGAEYLSEGDTISLADVTKGRYSLFEPGKSFFGLVKLSDMKIK